MTTPRCEDHVSPVRPTDRSPQGDPAPDVLLGTAIYSGSTRLAEMAARMGFDVIWIEMEHGPTHFDRVEQLCMATETGGAMPLVRVPDGQRHHVLHALEVGASIVVVPMTNTPEQARQIVQFGKFPPLGIRGFNTRSRGMQYGLHPTQQLMTQANRNTHLIAQVETVESVSNLDAILDVKGLSGILVGPGDLSATMGCSGELTNPKLIETVVACIGKARQANKRAGLFVGPGPLLDAAINAGADLIISSGDLMSLAGAWRDVLRRMKPAARLGKHQ